ncbi:histone-lysine N-methyltransferase SMYD3 isoform X2 [Lutzomyia longipalpis]|uniref:histone-lysine N-methyltransferase SMYD3 isoform X2 n=2 Tax=Lutzomyia longipalpis TaxID=7200 RepID=UPI00248331A2|nr:histone-lysine N-methyltransferase SMYD3 isoform X2 [Lutzomyia longipalpis]XP_055677316.1 histone-lysine N-methyltransferase SMYD3 isoform X2 [Lutzomyia longipalpis]
MKKKVETIKQGTCILTEKPFVHVLKAKYRKERCDHCFSSGKVLKCSGCEYVYYCNRTCQTEAWNLHKIECPYLKKITPRIVPDAARILARIILKLQQGGDLEKGYYTKLCYRKFRDLMSHYHEIRNDPKRLEHLESLSMVLRDLLGEKLVPNFTELQGIYGRLVVNGFNILDGEMNSIGTGIYLGVSVVDHRCTPNAVATFEGTTLFVRALTDLPALDWSQIFISYVDLMQTPADRRAELKANYYFLCTCSRCIGPQEQLQMEAAACPSKDCDEYVVLQDKCLPVACGKCGTRVTEKFLEEFCEVTNFTKLQLASMKDVAYLDVCKICFAKQKNVLHRLNLWHTKTLDLAFESAIEMGKWQDARSFGQLLLPGFRKYNGDFNPLLGLLYMKLGKIELYLEHIAVAREYLLEASKILRVTHGETHSLYAKQLIPLLEQTCE